MADPTLYLFDGFNLLHAGGYEKLGRDCSSRSQWDREGPSKLSRMRGSTRYAMLIYCAVMTR